MCGAVRPAAPGSDRRGPPDFWIGETFSYTGEALLFVERAKATGLPVMATMCFERLPARSYEGDTPGEAAKRLADAGADIVGVNCLNGPTQQLPIAVEMVDAVAGAVPVASQPVGYATTDDGADFTSWPELPVRARPEALARGELAAFAADARDAGVRYIGSCCGSVAGHVRAMAKMIGKLPAEEREWRSPTGQAMSALRVLRPHRDRGLTGPSTRPVEVRVFRFASASGTWMCLCFSAFTTSLSRSPIGGT